MEQQFAFASRDDVWRLHSEMKNVSSIQAEHADRILRLERRQEEDARMKSVWGTSSPFPGILSGTPQQDAVPNPAAEAFSHFNDSQSQSLIGSLHLDNDDEPRRGASRANSVRFDESAIQGHWTQGSRSSGDFFPIRTGSGFGSHPMTERSSSYKSEGKQSSAGQSAHSTHSAHSVHSARTNSLGIDTGYRDLLEQRVTSPIESLGPPPGLFILGPVPSIIRCWLDTQFSNETLLYAAVCTGSYTSFLDRRTIARLQLEDQIIRSQSGEEKIKVPVYLPEAIVQQPLSRSSSPAAPPLPTLTIDFTVIDHGCIPDESKAIQIFIGSDVLRFHNADILFSQSTITMFDDDRKRLSVPLVRPEDDGMFKNLCTVNLNPHHIGRDATRSSWQRREQEQTPRDGSVNGSSTLNAEKQDPAIKSPMPINPSSPSITENWRKPTIGQGSRQSSVSFSSPNEERDTASEPRKPASISAESTNTDNDSTAATSALRQPSSSGIWGSWRRDNPSSTQESPIKADSTTPTNPTGYQRAPRPRGMKVLKPARSTTTTSTATASFSSHSFSQPNGGPQSSDPLARRRAQLPGLDTADHPSSPYQVEATRSAPIDTGVVGSPSSAGAVAGASSTGARELANATNKPRSANPVGGASAFAWLNPGSAPSGPGQGKRSAAFAE
ncbi:MAG: hypothetical protein M1819_001337 [Sarea resinae]|nr:MAG: hypothetical protein M1819_001337 [Sarea resinae]